MLVIEEIAYGSVAGVVKIKRAQMLLGDASADHGRSLARPGSLLRTQLVCEPQHILSYAALHRLNLPRHPWRRATGLSLKVPPHIEGVSLAVSHRLICDRVGAARPWNKALDAAREAVCPGVGRLRLSRGCS
jgi:hypothetical protein